MRKQINNIKLNDKVVATITQDYYYILWFIRVTTKVTVVTHQATTVEINL